MPGIEPRTSYSYRKRVQRYNLLTPASDTWYCDIIEAKPGLPHRKMLLLNGATSFQMLQLQDAELRNLRAKKQSWPYLQCFGWEYWLQQEPTNNLKGGYLNDRLFPTQVQKWNIRVHNVPQLCSTILGIQVKLHVLLPPWWKQWIIFICDLWFVIRTHFAWLLQGSAA